MNLTISIPDAEVQVLQAKASAQGVTAEEYALQVLERDLAPQWLRESWSSAQSTGVDQLSMEEIEAEIAAARKVRSQPASPSGA